jgi:hypothetical protein
MPSFLTDMGELHRVGEAAIPHHRPQRGQAGLGENQWRPALGGVGRHRTPLSSPWPAVAALACQPAGHRVSLCSAHSFANWLRRSENRPLVLPALYEFAYRAVHQSRMRSQRVVTAVCNPHNDGVWRIVVETVELAGQQGGVLHIPEDQRGDIDPGRRRRRRFGNAREEVQGKVRYLQLRGIADRGRQLDRTRPIVVVPGRIRRRR